MEKFFKNCEIDLRAIFYYLYLYLSLADVPQFQCDFFPALFANPKTTLRASFR